MTALLQNKPDVDAKAAFLEHVEHKHRSTITNRFLAPPRAGIVHPQEIVAAVKRELVERIARAWSPEATAREQSFLHILTTYPQEALGMAAYCRDYVLQPEAARVESRRTQQTEHVNRWLSNQPASERQIAYLRSLGHKGEVASKYHASQLIEGLTAKQGGRK